MNEHRIGCVLVVEAGRLVGIFTERDVLTKVVTAGRDIDTTPVGEVMTRDPECLTLDDGIAYALNMMSVGGFRHIPLVDADGYPTGMVAMRDIVDYIVDLFPEEVLNLPPSPRTASRANAKARSRVTKRHGIRTRRQNRVPDPLVAQRLSPRRARAVGERSACSSRRACGNDGSAASATTTASDVVVEPRGATKAIQPLS